MKKIVVTIPAYNEENNIGQVIKSTNEALKKEYDLIIQVVDDGSNDNTGEVAKEAGAYVIKHPKNRGLSAAFKTEMKAALKHNPDVIVHIDADKQYEPKDIKMLLKEIDNGNDLVLGSRFKGSIEYMPLIKRIGNTIFSSCISKLSHQHITDSQTGLRAFTPDVARNITIISSYTYTQEQILRAITKGYIIKEVPITFLSRKDETRSRLMKNPLHYALYASVNVIRVYRDLKPLVFFGIFGLSMIIPGIMIGFYFLYLHLTTGIKGHLGLLFLMVLLLIVGFQMFIFAFLSDMLKGFNEK